MLSLTAQLAIAIAFGLVIGFIVRSIDLGLILLCLVPVTMIVYVWWIHANMIERLNSTSALDYIFGPLWPTLAAITGYSLGIILRTLRH